jgi:hypothetical protein
MNCSKLPKKPKASTTSSETTNDDYYIKTQAASTLPKYLGKGKGLEVRLTKKELAKLKSLKELFGDEFSLNQLIIYGYKLIENNEYDCKSSTISQEFDEKIKIKPTLQALESILKLSQEDAASILSKIGLNHLYAKLNGAEIDEQL